MLVAFTSYHPLLIHAILKSVFLCSYMVSSNFLFNNHYHHVAQLAQISLTLSCHLSLSYITSISSSTPHLVSVQSCYRYILVGRPTLTPPCEGVHWRTSLMSSFLLLQQCPACHVRLIWIILEKRGGRTAFLSNSRLAFISIRLVSVHVVYPYSRIDTTVAWEKLHFTRIIK